MPDFAITSPKLGIAENVPKLLLSEAFLTKDSENVHGRYGEYRSFRGRLAALYDADDEQIACPSAIYTITAINTGSKQITVTGDATSNISDGDTIRINGGTTTANNALFTVNGTPTYSDPSTTITVAEALSAAGATPGNVFAGTTPVLEYHRHVRKSTGSEYLLLGTAYHILLWGNSDRSLTVKFTCGTPASVERWEIIDHLRNVYATNNVDKVLWWNIDNSVSNDFAVLDDTTNGIDTDGTIYLTKAKHIFSHETYLFLGHTTEGGTLYPYRIRHASQATGGSTIDFDSSSTKSGNADVKDFLNTAAFVMGFGRYGDYLVVGTGPDVKTGRMYRGWLTTEATVFNWDEDTQKIGLLSADTLVNDKSGRLYWLGTDLTIRELGTPTAISLPLDITVRGINTEYAEFAQATFLDEFDEIAFALPTGSSETNDKMTIYNTNTGTQFVIDTAVRCFGDYTRQEVYAYDTLPPRTYADWGASWLIYDTSVNVVGFGLDLAADYSGNTYELHNAEKDAGNDITTRIAFATTLTSGHRSIGENKRVNNGAYFYFNRKDAGDVTVEVKRDSERNWQNLGSVSMADTALPEVVVAHLPFDIRAKLFEFRLSSTSYVEFLGATFLDFEFDGPR